jgi:hypothetical protein
MGVRDEHDPEPHIVCFGNPSAGFEYVGPFECEADAVKYTENHLVQNGGDFWVIMLQLPAGDE